MLSENLRKDLKNPWLRAILITIAITVAVNVVFISYAFFAPPNLVVKDYYERGKDYFHDANLRQEALPTAWRLQLMLPKRMQVNQSVDCRLYVMDHEGKPIESGKVMVSAYYASDATHDFSVSLQRVDTGTFLAPIRFPIQGHWDLIASIDRGEQHFDTAQRVFVEK